MTRTLFLGLLLMAAGPAAGVPARAETTDLHADYDALLKTYVQGDRVRYGAWARSQTDPARLRAYVDRLEAVHPEDLSRSGQLAYWINLYNAATLELVLDHYPVTSIKKIGGLLRSPWNRKVVTVDGKELSLNQIENDIIRPRFADARIHFALNCASIGCPPLADQAYRAERLDAQLDAACRVALNDARWVDRKGNRLIVTKIFEWYRADFVEGAGSVEGFIARYREGGLPERDDLKINYAEYDWNLNTTE